MSEAIYSAAAPKPIGPYSQAIRCGGLLFVSGQVAIDPTTGKYVPGTVAEEAQQVLLHVQRILVAAQLSFKDVVKSSIFLKSMGDFPVVNKVYGKYFPAEGAAAPARETVEVAALPLGAKVEISCIAAYS